jgi:ankyrin repeat protein
MVYTGGTDGGIIVQWFGTMAITGWRFWQVGGQGAEYKNVFSIKINDENKDTRKTLLLATESEADMRSWIDAIRATWVSPLGNTFAMDVAEQGDSESLLRLCQLGIDVNLQNNQGWTALMFAASGAALTCMAYLMK